VIFVLREGYKVFVPVHKSSTTGRYEVSGLLFLATESQDLVHRGLIFFKQSLPYTADSLGQRFHFFVDKDFSYIEVRRSVQCILLLQVCG